ncbi:malonate--CoA ligase [Rhizorhabdus dicambivorans]|uniref:3-methylmercaptopropionyl-CoA ligase n=1 Tax=Rhizorhabdus dicambivorans TaxID=1850238 RepID=A0A2A4FZP2_9SPHN|nr:malonyl-CoA synthase [Rhizorhabdus dicambivorans]ATE63027.1 malonyl-CoA synthase [Rhizorhabdus dicambivorans]PCE43203.1 malonyl-CoA synthase [Rhizorhabdus dicambivorans]
MANLYTRLAAGFPSAETPFAHLPDGGIVTYGDVGRRSAGFAHQLRAAGVGIGDRVAVQAEKSIDMLMLYLGALRAGAVFLPLNTAYTAGELDYFMRDAEPALFVCDPATLASIEPLAEVAGVPRFATLESLAAQAAGQPGHFDDVARDDKDLAAILYTSGTTGRSKGAMLSHDNLGSNAFMLKDAWRFTGADVLLHALPIFHTHGLFVATNTILAAGASMIFLAKFDARQVLAQLPRATTMMGVPTFYIRLLDDPGFTGDLVAHMRLFVSGSAPLSADIHREFRERTGHAILERYGMTETNMNISNPYDGDRIAGTVGVPLPGVSIRIADPETGAEMPQGEVGVVEISGPNVFQGYWRMPEKTAAEFRDGRFVSGDLGFVDARGYVSLVGRAKDLIISGGYNVYPAEVETALDELPQVHESAVIAVPHRELGEAPVAVIVPREPGFSDAEAIKAGLADQLARYKQPRAILFVDALPKNAMGKVQKALLREEHKDVLG